MFKKSLLASAITFILGATVAVSLQSCASVKTAIDVALPAAVNKYCQADPVARTVLRESLAAVIAPNRVEIQCHADYVSGGSNERE